MRLRFIIFAVLVSLVAAACGSDDTSIDAGSPGDGNGSDDTATTEEPLGGGGAIGTIEVTVTHPDVEPTVYTIGCMGDTFPVTPEVAGVDGEQACALLGEEEVLTRLVDGPPADQVCTEEYGGPDEARIVGQIDGRDIDATITRTNGCEISTWNQLIGLVPPPVGLTE